MFRHEPAGPALGGRGLPALCDPVFEAADVGFVRQVQYAGPGYRRVDAMLWEADPEQFAARYPDSGVAESYGRQWRDVS